MVTAAQRLVILDKPKFSPLNLSGLVWWLDAPTLGLADSAAVSSWTDRSPSKVNAAQGTGGKQPLYKVAIQNGLSVVRFDGIDDSLSAGDVTFLDGKLPTIFVVGRPLGANQDAFVAKWYPGLEVGTGFLMDWAGGNMNFRGFDETLGSVVAHTANTWGIFMGRKTATATLVYKGGGIPGTRANTAVMPNNNQPLVVGAKTDSGTEGGFLDGDIGEVLIYNRTLALDEADRVGNYLANRWGLTWAAAA